MTQNGWDRVSPEGKNLLIERSILGQEVSMQKERLGLTEVEAFSTFLQSFDHWVLEH